VLGAGNGPLPCDVLFVGEAPGRRGAGRTGVPFSGDESGRRFDLLLTKAGLRRDAVFITNAVLCLPLDALGRNRRPAAREVAACSKHLAATLGAVKPSLVVTLGAVGLAAVGCIEPHGLALRADVGRCVAWCGRTLVPLYHPGRQAQLHRAWDRQLEDWQLLGRTVSHVTRPRSDYRGV